MEPETLKEDLFYCMFAGDLKTRSIKDKSIFLVGESRVGKSTLFNYLLGHRLTGKELKKFKIVYQVEFQEHQTGSGFTSVTLLPNIVPQIRIGQAENNISVCDMAGFSDKGRSYVGVYSVSYMLKKSFQKTKNAQFMLVIDYAALLLEQLEDFLKPFTNFINMFKKNYLIQHPEVAQKLFDSVALVVTKTQFDIDFFLVKLSDKSEQLQAIQKQSNDQILAAALIKSILDNGRLQVFEAAKKDSVAAKSRILESLLEEQKKWESFSFQKTIAPEFIVELPFKKDFKNLSEQSSKKFSTAINERKDSFLKVQQILKGFLNKAIDSWFSEKIDYSIHNEEIKKFVKSYNVYDKQDEQERYISELKIKKPENGGQKSLNKLNLLKSIEAISNFTNQVSKVDPSIENTVEKLRTIKDLSLKLLKVFYQSFCQTRSEQKQFIIFAFLVVRGIQQLACLNEIEESLGSVFFLEIKDSLQGIMPEDISNVMAKFFINFKPSEQNLDEYQNIIEDFMKNKMKDMSNQEDIPKIYQIQIKNKMKKGKCFQEKGMHKQAILQFIGANQNLTVYHQQYCSAEDNPTDKALDLIEARTIDIYSKIGSCLQSMKIFHKALPVYEHIECVESQNMCFEKLIQNNLPSQDKYQKMLFYAEFCEKHGRDREAVIIYQRMLKQFTYMPRRKQFIREKIDKCLTSDQSKTGSYRQKLIKYKRIENKPSLIEDIKDELEMHEEVEDKVKQDPDDIFENDYKGPVVQPESSIN